MAKVYIIQWEMNEEEEEEEVESEREKKRKRKRSKMKEGCLTIIMNQEMHSYSGSSLPVPLATIHSLTGLM